MRTSPPHLEKSRFLRRSFVLVFLEGRRNQTFFGEEKRRNQTLCQLWGYPRFSVERHRPKAGDLEEEARLAGDVAQKKAVQPLTQKRVPAPKKEEEKKKKKREDKISSTVFPDGGERKGGGGRREEEGQNQKSLLPHWVQRNH